MAALFIGAMFIGFAPVFYLRPAFKDSALPVHLIVHGAVMTAWFALFGVQCWLVTRRNLALHMNLGVLASVVAVLVVVTGLITLTEFVPTRVAAGEVVTDANFRPFRGIIAGNTVNLVFFSGFVTAALLRRRQPPIHKRLMLLASVIVAEQPFEGARSGRTFAAALQGLVPDDSLGPLFAFLCCLSLLGYDYMREGRVQRATLLGVIAAIPVRFALAITFIRSDLGLQWSKWMAGL